MAASPSFRPSPLLAVGGRGASMTANDEPRAGGGGGADPDDGTEEALMEDDIAGAAEFEDDSDLEDVVEPAAGDRLPAAAPSAAAAVAAQAKSRPEASPSSPRLEKWPGFPCPSKAFARAAPIENPKGLLPPSPDFLGFIHQVT